MFFTIHTDESYSTPSPSRAYLVKDDWNDWFRFVTRFSLIVYDAAGQRHDVGSVKIGRFGMKGSDKAGPDRSPDLPTAFDELDDQYFSLGQDENYYETLWKFPPDLRTRITHGLRDVAADLALFEKARQEEVMTESLLRYIDPSLVTRKFSQLIRGYAPLFAYHFQYHLPRRASAAAPVLQFHVSPHSSPPSNIHVLIGRNGVGKTSCLQSMSYKLVHPLAPSDSFGEFIVAGDEGTFTGLVSVTFSAFDPFGPLTPDAEFRGAIRYSYIGLKTDSASGHAPTRSAPKGVEELASEFVNGTMKCRASARIGRWRDALQTLESDPLFLESNVTALAEEPEQTASTRAREIFAQLSSGHKIVLLIVTRLVETVDEKTLVLIDEPEAHLHPPLLSAFIRCLSDLLTQRNGVAVVATHSPVVLQEVPRSAVWVLRRSGNEVRAERPQIETFGENVGVLTREVFGLEVSHSGYHKLLESAIDAAGGSYAQIVAQFGEELGSEARALVNALIAERYSDEGEE